MVVNPVMASLHIKRDHVILDFFFCIQCILSSIPITEALSTSLKHSQVVGQLELLVSANFLSCFWFLTSHLIICASDASR